MEIRLSLTLGCRQNETEVMHNLGSWPAVGDRLRRRRIGSPSSESARI